jgi:hypothetical protein
MRKEYIWAVKARNTPLLKRKCNHCDSDKFYCSEKFRMNAHKKNIDIWLIYRCLKCDNTYNMTIFSRIKTELINKDLFNKFSENNTDLAWKYAFSFEISRKNNVELDFGSVEYDIQYEYISLEDILNFNCDIVAFKIKYPFDFSLKLSSVIKICIKLSANKLNKLIEAKVISIQEKHLQKKHKVKNEDIVQVNREKLRSIYHIWLNQ